MSHGKNYPSKYGKKKDYCPVRCSTDVELDLDVNPKVACREVSRCGTEFDIELEFKVDHDCKLIPKRTYKDECGCVTKCVFGVQLDFHCEPKVRHNPCKQPHAEFELDVELDVTPHCKPIEDCKVRYYKIDDKRKEEEKEKEKEKEHKKENKHKKEEKKDKKEKKYYNDEYDCDCEVCKPPQKGKKDNYWM